MQKLPATLVETLHNPACYDHPADRVKLVETHISWVFLVGDFAYKLKKPVNFGFLDFSTLSKRQHFCQEELRLNKRYAPQLYLEVVSVGGSTENPILGGSPAIDYLVKMKRFSRDDELDRLLQQERLSTDMIEQFADYLADIHQRAPCVDPRGYFGCLDAIKGPVQDNFAQLRPLLPEPAQLNQLTEIEHWSQTSLEQLRELMTQRKERGFIRECHGDVHLANMVWQSGQPILFDCIEFNDNFRCIDTVNDYAFLLMDLDDRGAEQLSWHFLNRYLQQSGDYQGLLLLNFYKSYRAMVRAKVTGLRLQQVGLSATEQAYDNELLRSYLDLATSYGRPANKALIICHGLSGSGKSTFIKQLAPLCAAISINSDIERKRLHGLTATVHSASGIDAGIYTDQAGRQTYDRLQELAETILRAGFTVIIDATFLKQQQREQMWQLAKELNVPHLILDFPLSEAELFRRVELRSRQTGQASEATPEVLKNQLEKHQPLNPPEEQCAIKVSPDSSPEAIAALIAVPNPNG